MECLVSTAEFPSPEEVLRIFKANEAEDASDDDKRALHDLDKQFRADPGKLNRFTQSLLERFDLAFRDTLVTPQDDEVPTYLFSEILRPGAEGPETGSSNLDVEDDDYQEWLGKKGAYIDKIIRISTVELERLSTLSQVGKEMDNEIGFEEDMDPSLSTDIAFPEPPAPISDTNIVARLIYYYHHPYKASYPLPTPTFLLFLNKAFSKVRPGILEVRR